MSSQRLPGKSLLDLDGIPLLGRVIERVSLAKHCTKLVVATSTQLADLEISKYCQSQDVKCYRGSLNDVASRYIEIARLEKEEYFVRISGDSPLIDPELIDMAVEISINCVSDIDIVTNIMHRSFPKGQSIELVRSQSLIEAYPRFQSEFHYEHVTTFFYEHPEGFMISNFSNHEDMSQINLSIDTADDLKRIQAILMKIDSKDSGWKDMVTICGTL